MLGPQVSLAGDDWDQVAMALCRLFTGVHSCPSVIRRLRQKLHLVEKDPVVEEARQKGEIALLQILIVLPAVHPSGVAT